MTEPQTTPSIARVRAIAMLLPGAHETVIDEATVFLVDQQPFVKVDSAGRAIVLRTAEDGEIWTNVDLGEAADWTLIEDRIARSWELSAPTGLLEAGGR